jgi:asparagine N-glycosylation enzyme membrane subunit Stt3
MVVVLTAILSVCATLLLSLAYPRFFILFALLAATAVFLAHLSVENTRDRERGKRR